MSQRAVLRFYTFLGLFCVFGFGSRLSNIENDITELMKQDLEEAAHVRQRVRKEVTKFQEKVIF